MAELKVGGNDVKIMYGDREIGGATKLEPGTILYKSETSLNDAWKADIKSIHLLSTTEDWSNVNGISIIDIIPDFTVEVGSVNVPSDDFKNLDTKKEYKTKNSIITVSISIVDGEYRLNASSSFYGKHILLVKAI